MIIVVYVWVLPQFAVFKHAPCQVVYNTAAHLLDNKFVGGGSSQVTQMLSIRIGQQLQLPNVEHASCIHVPAQILPMCIWNTNRGGIAELKGHGWEHWGWKLNNGREMCVWQCEMHIGVISDCPRMFDGSSIWDTCKDPLQIVQATQQMAQHKLAPWSLGVLSVLLRALGVSITAMSHEHSLPSRDASVLLVANNVLAATFLQWGREQVKGFLLSFFSNDYK